MATVTNERELRDQMVAAGRLLWERDLVGATEGNLSCRLGDHVLCTPSGLSKGHLTSEQLVVIDHAGNPLDGGLAPSSEIRLHLRLYREQPETQAVVHAHPLTATAFAACGETVPVEFLPEAVYFLGPVALVPFGMPGTDELPDQLTPFCDGHRTFLLANHGAATVGSTLLDAAHRMETLERVAQIVFRARQIGQLQPLPADALARLRQMAGDEDMRS